MALILSIILGFLPMYIYAVWVYWIDHYEKEPKQLLRNVFLWGALIAAGGAFFINTFTGVSIYAITGSETAADITTSTIVAPLVEETLKGLAVLLVFLFFRNEFDSILDGIIYAAITALGFAATENAYYIYTYGYQESGFTGIFEMTFIRAVVVGWQHPFYTAFIGIGLAIARTSHKTFLKVLAPLLGWTASVTTHAIHNALASSNESLLCFLGSFLDWSGWIALLVFVFMMVNRERKLLIQHLAEEVQLGTITLEQYKVACSPIRQSRTRLQAWKSGNRKSVEQFFNFCGELAHKKNQYLRFGDENDNLETIQRLRNEISSLSPAIY